MRARRIIVKAFRRVSQSYISIVAILAIRRRRPRHGLIMRRYV